MRNLFFAILAFFIPTLLQAQNNGIGYDPEINDLFVYIIPVDDVSGVVVNNFNNLSDINIILSEDSTAAGLWRASVGDTVFALIDNKINLWHDSTLVFDFSDYLTESDFIRGQNYQVRAYQVGYPQYFEPGLNKGDFGNSFFFMLTVPLRQQPNPIRIGLQ